jgi:uncharacterized coiled-coil protein SlyX
MNDTFAPTISTLEVTTPAVLAIPAQHISWLEASVGAALIAAVSKIFEARIAALELVTKEQCTMIEVLTAQLAQLDSSFEKEIASQLEDALDSIDVESTIIMRNRRFR